MKVAWRGVFPAVTTQFKQDLSLDPDATAKHIDLMIKAGIQGAIMLGTVGENSSLEYDEKLTMLKVALEAAAGRIPVLTGVAEYTTALVLVLPGTPKDGRRRPDGLPGYGLPNRSTRISRPLSRSGRASVTRLSSITIRWPME